MATGTVVRFDEVRGYGFIAPDTGGEDVFMHINDLEDEKSRFATGTAVEFQVTEGERGLKAFDVRVRHKAGEPEPVLPRTVHPGSAGTGAGAGTGSGDDGDEAMSDVLSGAEYTLELTEVFLRIAPELTGAQIVTLRQGLVAVARDHGWVEA